MTNSAFIAYRLAKQRINAICPDVEDLFRCSHKVHWFRAEILSRYKAERKTRIQLQNTQAQEKMQKISECKTTT